MDLLCFLQPAIAFIPIDVLHERVNVHCGIRAIIHVVGMLEHIVDQDRPSECDVVSVIERNVIVKFAVTKVEVQNCPATAASQRR